MWWRHVKSHQLIVIFCLLFLTVQLNQLPEVPNNKCEMPNIKEALTLKRFILRSEVLKMYKNYMKIGRLIEELNKDGGSAKPYRQEWVDWVRCEFQLRKDVEDELTIKTLLSHGSRQLQELERSIRIANC